VRALECLRVFTAESSTGFNTITYRNELRLRGDFWFADWSSLYFPQRFDDWSAGLMPPAGRTSHRDLDLVCDSRGITVVITLYKVECL